MLNISTKRIFHFLFLFTLSHIAFATCYEDVDKFKGDAHYWCGAWGTNGSMLGGLWGVDPIPYLSVTDGKKELYLKLVIDQDRPMSIKAGNQLIFLLSSGDKINLTAISDAVPNVAAEKAPEAYESVIEIFTGGSARNSQKSSTNNATSEYAIFPITLEQINKLANAKEADFAVYADKQRIERKIGKPQIDIYKEFKEQVLKVRFTDPQSSTP